MNEWWPVGQTLDGFTAGWDWIAWQDCASQTGEGMEWDCNIEFCSLYSRLGTEIHKGEEKGGKSGRRIGCKSERDARVRDRSSLR